MPRAAYVPAHPPRARRAHMRSTPSRAAPPLPVSHYRPSTFRARRRPRAASSLPRAIALTAGLALVLIAAVSAFFHTAYQGRALPGAHVGQLHLAGLSESETRGVLDVAANPLLAAPAVF